MQIICGSSYHESSAGRPKGPDIQRDPKSEGTKEGPAQEIRPREEVIQPRGSPTATAMPAPRRAAGTSPRAPPAASHHEVNLALGPRDPRPQGRPNPRQEPQQGPGRPGPTERPPGLSQQPSGQPPPNPELHQCTATTRPSFRPSLERAEVIAPPPSGHPGPAAAPRQDHRPGGLLFLQAPDSRWQPENRAEYKPLKGYASARGVNVHAPPAQQALRHPSRPEAAAGPDSRAYTSPDPKQHSPQNTGPPPEGNVPQGSQKPGPTPDPPSSSTATRPVAHFRHHTTPQEHHMRLPKDPRRCPRPAPMGAIDPRARPARHPNPGTPPSPPGPNNPRTIPCTP
ncbi:PREDICTED: proline-rich protein HaeIII subfamily 1-like [Cyprinodon variegatus]|uniref:proline-rich protein HaeIII subfamily 1-like n=1 Tax=Cyprinodon variegatus TaxID=28743 RepID=UPI000742AAFA|nr:PREDICTED: proline-rich protein HaeIII subfamily 1-like [Cyprinodon variegatus]